MSSVFRFSRTVVIPFCIRFAHNLRPLYTQYCVGCTLKDAGPFGCLVDWIVASARRVRSLMTRKVRAANGHGMRASYGRYQLEAWSSQAGCNFLIYPTRIRLIFSILVAVRASRSLASKGDECYSFERFTQ